MAYISSAAAYYNFGSTRHHVKLRIAKALRTYSLYNFYFWELSTPLMKNSWTCLSHFWWMSVHPGVSVCLCVPMCAYVCLLPI